MKYPRLSLPVQVWLYAIEHDGEDLQPCQLREEFGRSSSEMSRAIRTAVRHGLLETESHARRLRVRRDR